jgi:hypothetical protein
MTLAIEEISVPDMASLQAPGRANRNDARDATPRGLKPTPARRLA